VQIVSEALRSVMELVLAGVALAFVQDTAGRVHPIACVARVDETLAEVCAAVVLGR
jgi:hypothetical protein